MMLFNQIRYALRSLDRARGLAVISVLTVAPWGGSRHRVVSPILRIGGGEAPQRTRGAVVTQDFLHLSVLKAVLSDLLDFAIADAGGANLHAAAGAFHESANRLQVDVPTPLSDIVGVADPVAELRPPPANLANLCHKTEISLAFRKVQYTSLAAEPATSAPAGGCASMPRSPGAATCTCSCRFPLTI